MPNLDRQSELTSNPRVNAAIAEYLEAIERGEPIPSQELLTRFSDVAEDLQSFLSTYAILPQTFPHDSTVHRTVRDGPENETVPKPVDGTNSPSGTQFGDYELLEEIARGGMGIVYRARQISLNRIVALKVILAGPFASAEDMQRFRREAETAAQLNHPGIVPIHEVGQHDGQHFYAMSYVPGSSLAQQLVSGPLAQREAARIVRAAAEAVDHAHRHGIVHRDIKPANVLIDPTGKPQIIDFGLARRTADTAGLTHAGQVLGSPNYMPPEQIVGSMSVGPRADVYALGATLYSAITGRPPFQAADIADTLRHVREEEPVPPRRLDPSIPIDLEKIVLKCLEKSPERRYGTAGELVEDLDYFLSERPVRARSVGRVERCWRWCRRNRALAAAGFSAGLTLIALVATLIGFSVYYYSTNHRLRLANEAAEHDRRQARVLAANLAWDRGRRLCEENQTPAGLLWIGRGLELLPENEDGLRRAMHLDLGDRLTSSHQLEAMLRHPGEVRAVSFLDHGKSVLTACADGIARLWDVSSGTLLHAFRGHEEVITAVAAVPNRSWIFTASSDGTVRRWDALTGQGNELVLAHPCEVRAMAHSLDGQWLATGGADGRVRLWSVESGQAAGESISHRSPIDAIAISPDCLTLAASAMNEELGKAEVRFGRVDSALPINLVLHRNKRIRAIAFSPDGRLLLTGDDNWDATLWNTTSGEALDELIHFGQVSSVAFSPDGQFVLTASDDTATGHIWNLPVHKSAKNRTEREAPPSNLLHRGRLLCVDWSSDGAHLVTGGADGMARVWRRGMELAPQTTFAHSHPAITIAVNSTGARVAVGYRDGQVRVWPEHGGSTSLLTLAHPDRVNAVTFTPDDRQLITGCVDGLVRFWDPIAGTPSGDPLPHSGSVETLACNRAGTRILVGCKDGTLWHWDLATRDRFSLMPPKPDKVCCVAFDDLGAQMAMGSEDGWIYVWSAGQDEAKLRLRHRGRVNWLTFSANGRTLLSGSADGTAKLWDTSSGIVRAALDHGREVSSVFIVPDHFEFAGRVHAPRDDRTKQSTAADDAEFRFILLGSYDGTAQLWSVETGKRVGAARIHPNVLTRAILAPDGKTIWTTCWDGGARRWRLPQPQLSQIQNAPIGVSAILGLTLSETDSLEILDDTGWHAFKNKINEPRTGPVK